MKPIAVLTVTYNSERFIEDYYRSLKKNKSELFDIFCLDNNSKDETTKKIKTECRDIKLIKSDKNLGFTGAYNRLFSLIKKKKYETYIVLNPDTTVEKDFIEKIYLLMKKYPNAGIVVASIVDKLNVIDSVGGTYVLLTGTNFGKLHGENYIPKNIVTACDWASGAGMAIRKKVLEKVNCFEDYFMYFEDISLSWKVQLAGYDVVATQWAKVSHSQGGSKAPSAMVHYLSERNRIITHWINLPFVFFFLHLPLLLIMRIGFLIIFNTPLSIRFAKARGIIEGLKTCRNFKRFSCSEAKKYAIMMRFLY
jgi:hypothetical protein